MKRDINQLLDRYHRGICSDAEIQELKNYFDREDMSVIDRRLKSEWNHLSQAKQITEEKIKKALLQKITERAESENHIRARFPMYKITAAAVLLLLVSFYGVWTYNNDFQPSNNITTIYNDSHLPQKYSLADGSQIWLTPNSRLTYSDSFNIRDRVVGLIGEGRFDIQSDTTRPFLVKTAGITTKVVGTVFNVAAYSRDSTIEIALFEGQVHLHFNDSLSQNPDIVLMPGEEFYFNKSDTLHIKHPTTNIAQYQWQDGYLHFERTAIHEVVKTLEQWYNINIHISNEIKANERLVHKIDNHQLDIDEILSGIALVSKYQFEKISKNEYILKNNSN